MPTLPASAQAILNRIRSEDADFIALNASRQRQLRDVKEQKGRTVSELSRLEGEDRAGRLTTQRRTGDLLEISRNEGALSGLAEQVAAYDRRIAELQSSTVPERLTGHRIDNVLTTYKRAEFVVVARPALPKKERPADVLGSVRFDLDALRTERTETERLPCTAAEAKKAARAEVATRIRVPQVMGLFQGHSLILPQTTLYLSGGKQQDIADTEGLFAFVFEAELLKKIDALIDFNASAFPGGISASDRAAKLADIDKRIADFERLAAAAVEAVIAEGGQAYHRPTSNVLTALGIAVA